MKEITVGTWARTDLLTPLTYEFHKPCILLKYILQNTVKRLLTE